LERHNSHLFGTKESWQTMEWLERSPRSRVDQVSIPWPSQTKRLHSFPA